jgi:hypothetical protein
MKKLYTIMLLLQITAPTFASSIDSTFLKNFHLGVGVTTGVQQLKYYKSYSPELKHTRGFEVGALTNLQYKFWKHNSLIFDFRLMQSNAVHKYTMSHVVEHTLNKQQIGLSYSRSIHFKGKNLFNVSAGFAHHFSNEKLFYQIDPLKYPPFPEKSTVEYRIISEDYYKEYSSLIFGLSKSHKIFGRFTYNTFVEFDYGLNKMNWGKDINKAPWFFQSTTYRPMVLRLGLTVVY